MIGQALGFSETTPSSNRLFVYEVEGLKQNEETDKNDYSIRQSSTISLKVPYSRMNQEMQRITRLGGKIVNIRPYTSEESASEEE
jgi:hypothetical protein